MSARHLPLGLALAIALCGCSLVKLSDDIVIGKCEDNGDCEVLNDRSDPEFDPCFLWQCNESEQRCEEGPLDDDDDGFVAVNATSQDGEVVDCDFDGEPDCNDADGDVGPGLPELCDAEDNDCDGRTDEGILQTSSRPVISFQEENAGGPVSIAYAVDPESGATAVAYAIEQALGNPLPGVSLVPEGLDALRIAAALEPPGGAVSLRSRSVGVAATDGQMLALAFFNLSGASRTMVVTAPDPGDPSAIELEPDMATYGLACLDTEACADNTAMPEMAIAAPPTTGVSIAALGDQALVSYLRADETTLPACEKAVDASDKPRLLVGLSALGAAGALELPGGPLDMGETAGTGRAAAVGVPPLMAEGDEVEVGFVLAWVESDGRLALSRVWDDTEGPRAAPLLRLGNEPASQPAIALGPVDEGRQRLAVAQRRDCGVDSRIVVHLVDLFIDADGGVTAERTGQAIVVHDGASQSRPAVAFSEQGGVGVWAVVYRDPQGLRARMLETDGRIRNRGQAPYVLLDREPDAQELSLTPHVAAGGSSRWFTAMTPVRRVDADMERTVDAIELYCE